MDKSQVGGVLICLVSVVVAVLFLWGIAVQNYWALAIPVIIGILGVAALAFWIGWTMATTSPEVPSPQPAEGETKATETS